MNELVFILSTFSSVLRWYTGLLTWPLVTFIALVVYRNEIKSLMKSLSSSGKFKLRIAGFDIDATSQEIEAFVAESLHGRKLNSEQWSWLRRLDDEGRTPVGQHDIELLRPLRDAALLRAHPEGLLQNATHVQITTLGRLLVNASKRT